MSSEFDRVARAIGSGMPRRKLFRLMAGGALASLGTAIMGEAASAKTSQEEVDPSLIYINYPWPICFNTTWPPIFFNTTWPPIFFNKTSHGHGGHQ